MVHLQELCTVFFAYRPLSKASEGAASQTTGVKKSMRMLFDILKKDRRGTFQWLETVSDIETAKARVLQLSSESPDEFIIFREVDLQVVATSRQFPEQRLSFAD